MDFPISLMIPAKDIQVIFFLTKEPNFEMNVV